MSVLERLASSLGNKGAEPNKQLANELAETKDKAAIKELVTNLHNKAVQSDCIKVLYELGEKEPTLIADYVKAFLELLDNKNNRMQWGGMTALDMITLIHPALIYNALGKITDIAEKGSVITKDHFVSLLLKLCTLDDYKDNAYTLFIEQLQTCPTNQLPMYAEQAVSIIDSDNKPKFMEVLTSRLPDVEKDAKRKRIAAVMKKV